MQLKRCICSIFILICFVENSFGHPFDFPTPSTRVNAMGGASAAFDDQASSLYTNPAGLIFMERLQISFFSTRLYNLRDLSYHAVFGGGVFKNTGLGMGWQIFGNKIYREQVFSLAGAKKFLSNFFLGIGWSYSWLSIQQYGSRGYHGISMGILWKFSSHVAFGASGFGLNQSKNPKTNEALPFRGRVGISLKPVEDFACNIDWKKETRVSDEFQIGGELRLGEHFLFRTGFTTHLNAFSGGLAFLFEFFNAEYALRHHSILGSTHQILLSVFFY